jgi:hypothetical protein
MDDQEELEFIRTVPSSEKEPSVRKTSTVHFNLVKTCRNGIFHFFSQFVRELVLNGEERVERGTLDKDDFKLDEDDHVAKYDTNNLERYWKQHVVQKTLGLRIFFGLTNVMHRTFPMLFVYLSIFYFFTTLLLIHICPSVSLDINQTPVSPSRTHQDISVNEVIIRKLATNYLGYDPAINGTHFCNGFVDMFKIWREKEVILTRILTFLIGFYVSFIVRNWWQQLKTFPAIDTLCISMGSFISIDTNYKESEVEVQINRKRVSVKKFKKDIVRLFLLSWTMCFCRISTRLRRKFKSPEIFNSMRLITRKEYNKLKTKNVDGWLEKWSTPLLWANKMICTVDKEMKDSKGNLQKLVNIKETKDVGLALFKFKDALQQLTNQYYFKIPGLMHQVICTALYFFLCLGVLAGQGTVYHTQDKMSLIGKLVFNFPLYYCMKYILLIGWIKIAKDLQNPFGDDR